MSLGYRTLLRWTVGAVAGVGIGLPFAVVALGILIALPRAGFVAIVLTLLTFGAFGVWMSCCSGRETFPRKAQSSEPHGGNWTMYIDTDEEAADDHPEDRFSEQIGREGITAIRSPGLG